MAEQTMAIFKAGVPIFTILQDTHRQQILVMLCRTDQMTVNQITAQVALSRPAVSHHLKLMLDAGIVAVNQTGTERYYRANMGPTLKLLRELTASLEADIASQQSSQNN
ncbi:MULTISPECIES: ArsR/SmtB family transcription factor [Lactiplantibacillus]|uniref:Metalloregulator ArsR/SmtB family transcription factor n=1 Tax=Lactiplantibacillus pentosus TaxID=1589 RepID=A0AAW8WA65_LACPE|nr:MULTISPECIES: metalloregulator ArsR/SmtB family transcription factor [Lactiplantibacillus]AUI77249.1 transcriptional regulator [Lactiplantibacillus pentosus]MBU7461944.1 helix-turn-helix transcriptional regulator [Lactiplantibacillus pentosus]MBU7476540.1 helix-turn-helix transcriptional regulator [Lactiplantibacillus pentosus]MBU7483260.1 helix-turn-helix transcriptional regulator [Lactiplantibacillus sp. 30.2.29]MBU7486618.1 helix-turn-helix transcriptional regulator [Lactiplantibacillus 